MSFYLKKSDDYNGYNFFRRVILLKGKESINNVQKMLTSTYRRFDFSNSVME